ncbi:HD family phosphohydrolase [Clostridium algidicarnis]|uniref:HD family phosphohydrolase n=1 Tax=Clostridium algidicarnis TaxID=37659 RepID=UPI001C0BA0D2|nr:HD family phosphohydrolase [Clostridium algidicarnis]MBU3208798.1 HD family phosphohydrolase [Clostridium algidicarnis]MBU3226691.1 HD family phosphohydrolase [Clostridium algidicarnis]MBU3250398.1 HD family phosphohydrolase [Clostridium algidicarnis]
MAKEKGSEVKSIFKHKRALIFIISFIIIYFVSLTSFITKRYTLEAGDIARENIKANKEVIDKAATEAKEKQAIEEVELQFNQKPEVKKQALDNSRIFFNKINSLKEAGTSEVEILEVLKAESKISMSEEDFIEVIKLSKEDIKNLQVVTLDTLTKIYEGRIEENKPEDIKLTEENVVNNINTYNIPKNVKSLGIQLTISQIKPNFFYDKEKTEELKKQAIKDVVPVIIKKNQMIVKEGEPITQNQLRLLEDLALLNTSSSQWPIYMALAVMIFILLMIQWYYLYRYYKEVFKDTSKLLLISVINVLCVIVARSVGLATPFLIPLALGPMLITILINYKVSMALSVINCILISINIGFNIEVTMIAVLNAVLGSTFIRKMQQRNDIIYSAVYIGIINMVINLSMGVLLSNNIIETLKRTAFMGIATLGSGILTLGLLPLFESTFDIVTTVKLLELSNPNNPLLKKILMETPGTYHHSIMVANLAEMATEEVGGNAILARIAAYYHDAGKTKRPYFFKENQVGNENPHDKITPNLSTLIIISHVKDGLELAKEYNIPKVIQDVIQEHHGNTLVKYFYFTAKNNSEKPEDIKEEDFRYQGPIPKTKESGIIMLADGVEAAVRSIQNPTKGKIEEMVNNIIKDKLNDGQLNDCDLTLKDLEIIRKSFLKTLNSIYHQRIEYPSDNTKIIKEK